MVLTPTFINVEAFTAILVRLLSFKEAYNILM